MAEAGYIYSDDATFGVVAGRMLGIADDVQAAAKAMQQSISGELGPGDLEAAVRQASMMWAAGAGQISGQATQLATQIRAEVATYATADNHARESFEEAFRDENTRIDATTEVPQTEKLARELRGDR